MRHLALSMALMLWLGAAPAMAASHYKLSLDPVAYDNSTRDAVVGEGKLTATLDKDVLVVSGSFSGLSSPAVAAKLGVGLDFGVPATDFFADLTLTGARSGTVSGSLSLTPEQIAALNKRRLFLQLNTISGTDGSLWGWFEPVSAGKSPAGKTGSGR